MFSPSITNVALFAFEVFNAVVAPYVALVLVHDWTVPPAGALIVTFPVDPDPRLIVMTRPTVTPRTVRKAPVGNVSVMFVAPLFATTIESVAVSVPEPVTALTPNSGVPAIPALPIRSGR